MQVTEHMKFCPFCGEKIITQRSDLEHKIDFAKYAMEHEEAVRQRKEKHEDHDFKVGMLISGAFILLGFIGLFILYFTQK